MSEDQDIQSRPVEIDGLATLLCHESFRISLRPRLLTGESSQSPVSETGCIITSTKQQGVPERVWEFLVRSMRSVVESCPPHSLELHKSKLMQLSKLGIDPAYDVAAAINTALQATSSTQLMVGVDEIPWFESSFLRQFAFLRRAALPMMIHSSSQDPTIIDGSFLGLLFTIDQIRNTVATGIILRIREILSNIESIALEPEEKRGILSVVDRLKKSLIRAGFKAKARDKREATTEIQGGDDPPGWIDIIPAENAMAILESERLLDDAKRRQTSSQDPKTYTFMIKGLTPCVVPNKRYNGSLLVTPRYMSCEDFWQQVMFMEKANTFLTRAFFPGVSRPKLQKLHLGPEMLSTLQGVFFDEDGSLKNSFVQDVDFSSRHGYINFANTMCADARNDYRWQVPVKRHSTREFVQARSAIENILSQNRIVFADKEVLHDLGILIGGTEDQSLHHDITRQTTVWLPEDPEEFPTNIPAVPIRGWEFDRAAYNAAMAAPHAPSSVLIGLSGNGHTLLGVQKNLVDRRECEQGWCSILDGVEGEVFRIVRETDFLVVLEASPGAMFTGDFQHAGVRNFEEDSIEYETMMDFFSRVQEIAEEGTAQGEDYDVVMREIITMMCSFKGLNTICRFHCSTEPSLGPLQIPRNAVGFADCKPNPPSEIFDSNKLEFPTTKRK